MRGEKNIQAGILSALGARPDCRLFRNNVGVARYPDGSTVAYGLCPGSSDLIGMTSVQITPDMVGRRLAVFTAIEVKNQAKAKRQDNQKSFIAMVRERGGCAGFAASVDEALSIINQKGIEP